MAKKKVHYKRSTPVIRLRSNVKKLSVHATLIENRLRSWMVPGDPDCLEAGPLEHVKVILRSIGHLEAQVGALEDSGYVPPKRSSVFVPEVGMTVAVIKKYRTKYEEAYEGVLREDPNMLDGLIVRKILPSGEVVVQRGQRTPFMVRKSHLAPAKE